MTATRVTHRWPGARVVVNGGNCDWADINWVHSVHAAWPRRDQTAPLWFRAKNSLSKNKAIREEARVFSAAKLLIANSDRTRRDLIAVEVPPEKIRVIHLGCEPEWKPATTHERATARRLLNVPPDVTVVSFVGALGYDCNKGFDTLLRAWGQLRLSKAVLVAAGAGRGFSQWGRAIAHLGLQGSVRLLGFTDRVDALLGASDLFVSPARYEAFGLNVLEALCRGVPSIVSRSAGVSELYPTRLSRWLLADPEDPSALAALISEWYQDRDIARAAFKSFSTDIGSYTMSVMADKIIEATGGNGDLGPSRLANGNRVVASLR
jgi:glycosyltransferase involved in cell wall biosynthesis